MKIKIVYFILFIILCGILLNGYLHEQDIDDLAYVIALGFDKGTNKPLLLSVQISIPSENGSGESSNSSGDSSSSSSKCESGDTLIQSIECNSISSGLDEINNIVSKKLNLSHCKLIIFSEELASSGISEYINTLENNLELRANSNVIVSTTDASIFLATSNPVFENSTEKYYEMITSTSKLTGYSISSTLNDIYTSLDDSFKESCCMLGSIVENDEDSDIFLSGIAVFKNDKFIGTLNSDETIPYLLITNQLKECIVSVPSPFSENDYIDIHISDFSHTKTNVNLEDFSSPHISTSISLKAIVLSSSTNFNSSSENDILEIQNSVSNYISEAVVNYYEKTSKEYKSDIAGVGKYAVHHFLTLDDWKNFDWLSKYANSTYEANINVDIQSSYSIS
jgi:spore germination protein KC